MYFTYIISLVPGACRSASGTAAVSMTYNVPYLYNMTYNVLYLYNITGTWSM